MSETLTDKDIISTGDVLRRLVVLGLAKPYGSPALPAQQLISRGFKPAVVVKGGYYWNVDIVERIFNQHKKDKGGEPIQESELMSVVEALKKDITNLKSNSTKTLSTVKDINEILLRNNNSLAMACSTLRETKGEYESVVGSIDRMLEYMFYITCVVSEMAKHAGVNVQAQNPIDAEVVPL